MVVIIKVSVHATAEMLFDPARCMRARINGQLYVKRPILLGAAVSQP
jgi:hypothetical protein